ncbi:MAG: transporter [Chlorobi bacterium]|nr:transporter [Chlorobiota bacterium]
MKNFQYILLALLLFSGVNMLKAQGKWYASSSFQMVGSSFNDGESHNSYFLYGGMRYYSPAFSISMSVPVVFGSENAYSQIGEMYLPNDGGYENGGRMSNGSGMNGASGIGLGDLYLNGSFRIIKELETIPDISIEGYIKFPTATPNIGIGTGEFDSQIGIGLKKFIGRVSLFGQFGYLFIGDNGQAANTNPFTISAGIGYAFGMGTHSILLAYDSYTTIVQGVASPRQLALGYNYMINYGLFFTAIVSAGLNSSASDYTISGGLNFEL